MFNYYTYDGPVMIFDKCVVNRWIGQTYTMSESKARSNLAYQFRKQNGLLRTPVTLPGKITKGGV